MTAPWPKVHFGEIMRPNSRPYTLGADEDANLVGMRLYGDGPFHRELKPALRIAKKSHFVIKTGDVIYNKLFAWKGTFGIVPPQLDGMFVSDKFPTYELDRSRVAEGYLRWHFRRPQLWEEARGMSTGSAALSKLTLNPPKFLLLTIPLPPLAEQRRIVARIEELATLIAEARALRQPAESEVQALVRSSLRRLSESIAVDGHLGDVLAGLPRNGWSPVCDNAIDGAAVLSLGAVTGFRYQSTAFKRSSMYAPADGHFWLRPGDLLITRSNTPELVGHAAIYDGNPAPCIYPDLMMRLVVRMDRADPRFVWYWLQSPSARDFVARTAKGTSPTMKKISQATVAAIPYPTSLELAAQRHIVAELDALQAKVDVVEHLESETAEDLDALLPSILDRAFSGGL